MAIMFDAMKGIKKRVFVGNDSQVNEYLNKLGDDCIAVTGIAMNDSGDVAIAVEVLEDD